MPSRETFLRVVYGLDPMKPELTFGQDTMAVGDLLRAAVKQALAEQEARHRRELIETAIRELSEYAVCHCCRFGVVCTTCHRRAILRAELAALEVKP